SMFPNIVFQQDGAPSPLGRTNRVAPEISRFNNHWISFSGAMSKIKFTPPQSKTFVIF
ncbi:hypothetical protein L9F63_022874, partial [Diploptera punctata]